MSYSGLEGDELFEFAGGEYDEYEGKLTIKTHTEQQFVSDVMVEKYQSIRKGLDYLGAYIVGIVHNDKDVPTTIDIHYKLREFVHYDYPLSQPYGYEVYEKGHGLVDDTDARFSCDTSVASRLGEVFLNEISVLIPLDIPKMISYIENEVDYDAVIKIDTELEFYRELHVKISYLLMAVFVDVYDYYLK